MSGKSYVFIKSERDLWAVGFYKPDGSWEPESDHRSVEGAAARVAWLNGTRRLAMYDADWDQLKAQKAALLEALEAIKKMCGSDDAHIHDCARAAIALGERRMT